MNPGKHNVCTGTPADSRHDAPHLPDKLALTPALSQREREEVVTAVGIQAGPHPGPLSEGEGGVAIATGIQAGPLPGPLPEGEGIGIAAGIQAGHHPGPLPEGEGGVAIATGIQAGPHPGPLPEGEGGLTMRRPSARPFHHGPLPEGRERGRTS